MGWRLRKVLHQWVLPAAMVFYVGVSAVCGQEEASPLYHEKTDLVSPNPMLVIDLVDTPAPELVISDVKGRLRIYDVGDGSLKQSVTLSESGLTSPVPGDFTGQNRLDLAICSEGGEILILDGRNLELIASAKIGAAYALQPTVVPYTREDGSKIDRLVVVDQEGRLRCVEYDNGTIKQLWEFKTGSALQSPPVLGYVRHSSHLDVVATTKYGHIVIIDVETGIGEDVPIQETTSLPVSPLLVDIDGKQGNEVIFAKNNGEVECRRWDDTKVPKLEILWIRSLTAQPVSPPLLLNSYRPIGEDPLILQITKSSIFVLNGKNGEVIAKDISNYKGISTEGALVPSGKKVPELAFGLSSSLHVTTNLAEWIESKGSKGLLTRESHLYYDMTNSVSVAYPGPGIPAVILGISPEPGGHLYAFSTEIKTPPNTWPTFSPWLTQGGSPFHNSFLDLDWTDHEQRLRSEMNSLEAQWKDDLDTAIFNADWDLANELSVSLAKFNPYDSSYRTLSWKIYAKKYLMEILIISLAVILIGGFTFYKIIQFLGFRNLRRRAENATQRGSYDEARRFYMRYLTKRPKRNSIAVSLAGIMILQRDYSEETLDVYSKAYHFNLDNKEILHAYARALLLDPTTTEEAEGLYRKALGSFPEPALLEYGIGRCLLDRQDYDEAGKNFRSALRGGVATEALYHALCEVYLKTQNYSAKALPVYEQQFNTRQNDDQYLKAYLAAAIDGRKVDPQIETLCGQVLDFDPRHVEAYLQLARIHIQNKKLQEAAAQIHHALRIDDENNDAILLLAQCYMIQNRRDNDALEAYRHALDVATTNAEILKTMAGIYFEKRSFDEEAISTYRRSFEQNPNDPSTLKALAQTAQLTADHDLSIVAIESLASMGSLNAHLIRQLADAYVSKEVYEPEVEKVLREALRLDPDNSSYIKALAETFLKDDRLDADAVVIYEQHLEVDKGNLAISRQLARGYIDNNRYEQSLKVTKSALKLHPNDEEIQRLNALASLYDNKIDDAVSEYRSLLDRNPGDKDALVNLALAYGQKMRHDDVAIDCYEKAIEAQPRNDMLYLALGRARAFGTDPSKAVDCYKQALKCAEGNEQKVITSITSLLSERSILRLQWFLIELLVSYGNFREALEQISEITKNHPGQATNVLRALETIQQKDPKNLVALVQRGTLMLELSDVDQAIKVLEKANELKPGSADIQELLIRAYTLSLEKKDLVENRFRLGKIYYSLQEFDEGIGCFQKTAQDYRWEAESTKMLGKCFAGKGMLDLALQEFKKLVVDEETKDLLYELAQRYETKKDLVGAKTVYRQLFAADIDYKDVKARFEMLSGSTSDPMAFEKTAIVQQMSEEAARRYELLDELGRGAMGIVYRARDKELEEVVALKILPDNMSNNPEAVRRFKIEARNARKLSHPNIVRIHDIGEEMGRKYISMEYVDGTDLKRKIRGVADKKLPVEVVVQHSMEIADALGYAHRLGIVHRDIKPANIMLTSKDEVKITDFGIAKMMDQTGEGTMIGAVIGTPLYMSPEQVQGIPVDNRADVYSFGIMLYELLNGSPPFMEGDLAYQHIHQEPNPIEGLDPNLWAIVKKCLEKKKEDRWEKAEVVYEALRDYLKATFG